MMAGEDEKFSKLFVNGLSTKTTDDSLKSYFEQFGKVAKCVIAKKPSTNQSKGFAFVTFADPESLNMAQKAQPHTIDNRTVDCKRTIQDEAPENKFTINRMFVGGMNEDTTEEEIIEKFSPYGTIKKIDLIKDKNTGKYKRFCFVTFDDHYSVDQCVIHKPFILAGKKVEVRKANPKDEMSSPAPYGHGVYSGSSYGDAGDGSGSGGGNLDDGFGNSSSFNSPAYGGGPTRGGHGIDTPRGAGSYGSQ